MYIYIILIYIYHKYLFLILFFSFLNIFFSMIPKKSSYSTSKVILIIKKDYEALVCIFPAILKTMIFQKSKWMNMNHIFFIFYYLFYSSLCLSLKLAFIIFPLNSLINLVRQLINNNLMQELIITALKSTKHADIADLAEFKETVDTMIDRLVNEPIIQSTSFTDYL